MTLFFALAETFFAVVVLEVVFLAVAPLEAAAFNAKVVDKGRAPESNICGMPKEDGGVCMTAFETPRIEILRTEADRPRDALKS